MTKHEVRGFRCVAVVFALILFVWGALQAIGMISREQERLRRMQYEQSPSYQQGLVRELGDYCRARTEAPNAEVRKTLDVMILSTWDRMQTAAVTNVPPSLKACAQLAETGVRNP